MPTPPQQSRKEMTTDDIKTVQVVLETNDGQMLVGIVKDPMVIGMIAGFTQFVKIDESKMVEVPIKDLLTDKTEEKDENN